MGANMQRQAVPLIRPHAPFVGTGMEERAAKDSGELIVAQHAGTVSEVDAAHVVVYSDEYGSERYDLPKYQRSNQSTCINHRPIVHAGQKVEKGDGFSFVEGFVVSERVVAEDVLSTI